MLKAEDPYASMEKDQLISMIHFLVKSEDERTQENLELKDILYLKDGRYNIDNSLAERSLRPMTVERKNSLGFGSHAGVEVSVIYHTFIETCKMCGVSTLEYFKEFFNAAIKREQFRMYSRNVEREQLRIISKAVMQGRTDYENLLPMTIGIKKY